MTPLPSWSAPVPVNLVGWRQVALADFPSQTALVVHLGVRTGSCTADTGRVGVARGGEAADSATNVVAGLLQYPGARDEDSN